MEYSIEEVLITLPARVRIEIRKLAENRVGGLASVGEIRIMLGGGSSVLFSAVRLPLACEISRDEMARVLLRVCSGSLYAHLSTLREGFVSLCDGVRVGVCGRARYDGERLVGVDDVTALIYRIATVDSSLAHELCAAFRSSRRGMLVYSPAGGGKTTALRTLTKCLAADAAVGNVAVVDERCEFSAQECSRLGVAHLSGYKRALGAQIALRTLGARVIVIDELASASEGYDVRQFAEGGVRLVASAHASGLDELLKSDGLSPFLEKGIFDVFFGIFNTDGHYFGKVDRI